MKLYLNTSTNLCIARFDGDEVRWDAGHSLAEQIFTFLETELKKRGATWRDLTEITYFSGPGVGDSELEAAGKFASFTGLRIGAAVVNTLAHELRIPLYDHHGTPRPIIIPDYGRPARITLPNHPS